MTNKRVVVCSAKLVGKIRFVPLTPLGIVRHDSKCQWRINLNDGLNIEKHKDYVSPSSARRAARRIAKQLNIKLEE